MPRTLMTLMFVVLATAVRAQPSAWLATDLVEREMKFGLELGLDAWRSEPRDSALGARYLQTSLWDLDNDDDPFRVESRYEPQVFLRVGHSVLGSRWPATLQLEASFVHESNGLEQLDSRGWNRAQVELRRSLGERGWISGSWWKGFRVEWTNADLTRHRGNGALEGGWVSKSGGFGANARLGVGTERRAIPYGRVRLHWRPTLAERWAMVEGSAQGLALFAEAYVGTGEFLADAGHTTRRLAVGLALRSFETGR